MRESKAESTGDDSATEESSIRALPVRRQLRPAGIIVDARVLHNDERRVIGGIHEINTRLVRDTLKNRSPCIRCAVGTPGDKVR